METVPLACLLGMIFSPVGIALVCWKLSQRVRKAWRVHVAFPALVFLSEVGLVTLMRLVLSDDAPPGIGFGLIPLPLTFFGSFIVYYAKVSASNMRFDGR